MTEIDQIKFEEQIADSVTSFLLALREIAREGNGSQAISLLLLESVDAYSEVFDPYVDPPEMVSSLLSDDLTSIATALAHGLVHYRAGRASEALWWWQFSYVSTWGNEASGVLRALQSVVAHDRLDAEFESEQDQVAAADELFTP